MIENKTFYSVSDKGHFLFGMLMILGPLALGIHHPYICASLVFAWATIKEFIYDSIGEGVDERGSNMRDWVGYMTGSGLGLLLAYGRGVIG